MVRQQQPLTIRNSRASKAYGAGKTGVSVRAQYLQPASNQSPWDDDNSINEYRTLRAWPRKNMAISPELHYVYEKPRAPFTA